MVAAQEELVDPATALSTKWKAADDADAGSVDIIMIRTFQVVDQSAATVGTELVGPRNFVLTIIAGENFLFDVRQMLPPFEL
jgi:hypothetical protein